MFFCLFVLAFEAGPKAVAYQAVLPGQVPYLVSGNMAFTSPHLTPPVTLLLSPGRPTPLVQASCPCASTSLLVY